jgi:hypothetical protein
MIHERDTVGTPTAGADRGGHVYEDALVAKQYLFMKGIKKAKVILSRAMDDDSLFANGVPIGIFYELFIQRLLTQEEIAISIGTSSNSGLAKTIYDYVDAELSMPLNSNLTSNICLADTDPIYDFGYVVLSGGLSETYSLKQYINKNIQKDFPDLKVLDLTADVVAEDGFSILPNESAAYAASVGGALVALHNEEIKTMLSYSYGTWVNVNGVKCLDIFIDRGQILNNKNAFLIQYGFSGAVEGERLYSTVVTRADIKSGYFRGRRLEIKTCNKGKRYLYIGDEAEDYRRSVEDLYKLQTVAGGDDACIRAFYGGEEVMRICKDFSNQSDYILVSQGIDVDENGRISPTYGVLESEKSHTVRVYMKNGREPYYNSVSAVDIEISGPKISMQALQC